MTQQTSEQLAKTVAEFLHMIRTAADLKTIDVFVQLDLTITQVRGIFLLAAEEESILISEVADKLGLSAATAGRTVDRLATLGIVERVEDPDDRRSKRVSLTPTGQDLADTQRELMWDQIREFSGGLPTKVATALNDALRTALDSTPGHLRVDTPCTPKTDRN